MLILKYLKLYLLSQFIGFQLLSFAAAPIFHSVVAEKWMEAFEHYTPKQKRAFMLGTLYPDIRHQANIDRDLTHEYNVTIEDLKNTKDPFYKGMRLHSFVDETRKNYLKNTTLHSDLSEYPGDQKLFLKLLEDEILFTLYGPIALSHICGYLDTVDMKELRFNVSYTTVYNWHQFQALCFRYPPSIRFRLILLDPSLNNNYREKTMQSFVEYLPLYREKAIFVNYVDSIMKYYDELFSSAQKIEHKIVQKTLWKKFLDKLSMIWSHLFSVE